jgi:uncharacterized protein YndB with AHSA1/START domain
MPSSTDRIEKKVLLRAPLERVWRAISDARQFGSWFGVEFDGSFEEGKPVTGKIVPTTVDPEVAKMQEPHARTRFEFTIERIRPMTYFSFRWHPYAVDPAVDYSTEPATLVEFQLQESPEGTALTITESGFDRIPLARRAEAFTRNAQGWSHQSRLIEKYLARAA